MSQHPAPIVPAAIAPATLPDPWERFDEMAHEAYVTYVLPTLAQPAASEAASSRRLSPQRERPVRRKRAVTREAVHA